ncbi:hypothetical protein [Streptomyces sp. TRM68367]|uniref:hypothetical protein n=1 Tax=Streptomyces sp. TRM68367 TaxID=2758415 RepID=UPI00165A9AEC|nr:hypothetical protein [Streptomyces sp. TRM68367]MBC9729697.1 hypothetical protein [Streptomyces sp. TRM68367]
MKKRSMLAIASLATGFVVAAVTPSHAAGGGGTALGDLDVDKTLSAVDRTIAGDSLAMDDESSGRKG